MMRAPKPWEATLAFPLLGSALNEARSAPDRSSFAFHEQAQFCDALYGLA